MIKKQFILVRGIMLFITLFLFCTLLPVFAQSGSSVWKISKGGNTILLGGSIHVLRESDFPLPVEFDRAFEQSKSLVLEADIGRMADVEIVQYLMARAFLPGDQTLQSVLNPVIYKLFMEKCAEFGIPPEVIMKFNPYMAINVLTVMAIQKSGFEQQGVDYYYYELAVKTGKSLGFLETVETQIDMLVSIGENYGDDFIIYSLDDLENLEDIFTLVSDWREGDSASSEASLAEMKETWPDVYKTLMLDRNNSWMPQIEKYLATGSAAFIITGLAHLHGTDGLLHQLKNSGCTVEQFKF
jgi:uncharacterized protein YbaP (TraB family)